MEAHSPGCDDKTTGYRVGTGTFQIRTLLDQRQFSDPDGAAERAGISATSWPNFGTVWPAGLAGAGVERVRTAALFNILLRTLESRHLRKDDRGQGQG